MERFFVAFFGTLFVLAVGFAVAGGMIATMFFFGPPYGIAITSFVFAVFAGAMNYFDKPDEASE